MKHFSLLISLFITCGIYAQDLPEDCLLKKTILDFCHNNGVDTKCPPLDKESSNPSALPISYKNNLYLHDEEYILVVSRIENGSIHGHTFGCESLYLLQRASNKFIVVNYQVMNDPQPIMDRVSYDLVKIGPDKYALATVFQSTGNQHYEKNLSLIHLTTDSFDYILNLTLEYDNAAWNLPATAEAPCKAYKRTKSFELMETDKPWYDVVVTIRKYHYTNGCEKEVLIKEEKVLYVFSEGKYLETR